MRAWAEEDTMVHPDRKIIFLEIRCPKSRKWMSVKSGVAVFAIKPSGWLKEWSVNVGAMDRSQLQTIVKRMRDGNVAEIRFATWKQQYSGSVLLKHWHPETGDAGFEGTGCINGWESAETGRVVKL